LTAAKALFQLGFCHERLEDANEAIASYQKILDHHADQKDIASRAKERFAELLREKELRESKAIAVLPFKNMDGEEDGETFSDGITEEITTQLSKISDLKVIARTSTVRYRSTNKSLRHIGRELAVGNILEGSVRRDGNRVRISVQLINSTTEEHLWANTYDRDLMQILSLQGELASAIAKEVHANVTPEESSRLATRRPVKKEAYEFFLKAIFFWNRRTTDLAEKSIEYFNQAIAKDPNYAPAYSGLARSYAGLGAAEGLGISPKEAMRKAKEAALKAAQLDPDLSDTHTALGLVKLSFEWDWQGAEKDFRRALELNPNSADAHHWYSHLHMALGRPDESFRHVLRGLELDPVNGQMHIHLAWYYLITRHDDKLLETYRETIELFPDDPIIYAYLAQSYTRQGKYDLALVEAKKSVEKSRNNTNRVTMLAGVYASMGNEQEARGMLQKLSETSRYVSPLALASVYLALGDKSNAFKFLERAYEDRVAGMAYLKVDPGWDSLRSDPRFQDLVRRMNLPE
ncbi:MAG: tetratricopeptide repeat protein, partial [Ignavibacteriales bacterium]|nr:tetratricopeptide repeat protein [Ignavibacteriales bacterium]